jgi:DNA-binding transcriptional ArsR family regulator
MLDLLMGGAALTSGELARSAGVSASTATEHLQALEAGGLVRSWPSGRHRYVELAGPDVAAALEALSLICPPDPVRSLRDSRDRRSLRLARTCYDHLAGVAGVELHDALVHRRLLTTDPYGVTRAGVRWLDDLGVDIDAARGQRRSFARPCPDWTERRPHLAGALGAALTSRLLDRGWFQRRPGGRGLAVTARGREELDGLLGVRLPAWREVAAAGGQR